MAAQESKNANTQPPIPMEGDTAAPMMPAQNEPVSVPPQTVEPALDPTPTIPTPPGSVMGASNNPPIVTSGGGRRFSKKILLVPLLVLLVLVVGFIVVRLVLPNLGGGLGKNTELTWWGLWEDESIVTPLIQEYESQNPGVTIKYEKKNKEDYRERLISALASQQAPDIFRIHNSWVPMFRQELAPAPQGVVSSQDFQNQFYPVIQSDLVGINGPVAMPLGFDSMAMFINEEIFSTYGQPIPSDWNSLRGIARQLTIKDERGVITQSGAALGETANVDHWPEIVALLMLQNGANPNLPNDPTGRGLEALRFYKLFSDVDKIWDDTLPESTIAFAAGRVAVYFGPSWRALEIIDRNPSLKFRVEPVPQIKQGPIDSPDITYASYWVEGVNSGSENKDEAWKFLKFLSQRENLSKLYENASRVRRFGEVYPRPDMRDLLLKDSVIGGFVNLAPTAKSGFLYSRTYDGTSGINTSLSQYYEDALNAIDASSDRSGEREIATLATGVQQVLSRYGLAAPIPAPTQ